MATSTWTSAVAARGNCDVLDCLGLSQSARQSTDWVEVGICCSHSTTLTWTRLSLLLLLLHDTVQCKSRRDAWFWDGMRWDEMTTLSLSNASSLPGCCGVVCWLTSRFRCRGFTPSHLHTHAVSQGTPKPHALASSVNPGKRVESRLISPRTWDPASDDARERRRHTREITAGADAGTT